MAKRLPKKANTKPKLWTDTYIKKILPKALEGSGGIASVVANRLGISRQTLYSYQNKYPWIKEMRQDARETFVDMAEGKLIKKVREEEDWAIKFTLSSIGRHRGYDNSAQVVVNNNTLNADIKLSGEQKQEFLDFIDNKK